MHTSTGALRRSVAALIAASALMAVAACTPTSQTVGTPSPVASASAAVDAACSAPDLALTSTGWSAAAGSRGAEVSVENQGSARCALPGGPRVGVRSGDGTSLDDSPAAPEPGPLLEPAGTATFVVFFGNWCDEGTALPLRFVLHADDGAVQIPGLDMTGDDLPPCHGPGQPPVLTTEPWQVR